MLRGARGGPNPFFGPFWTSSTGSNSLLRMTPRPIPTAASASSWGHRISSLALPLCQPLPSLGRSDPGRPPCGGQPSEVFAIGGNGSVDCASMRRCGADGSDSKQFLNEVFIRIRSDMHYLWRAVERDIPAQDRRNAKAANSGARRIPNSLRLHNTAALAKLTTVSPRDRALAAGNLLVTFGRTLPSEAFGPPAKGEPSQGHPKRSIRRADFGDAEILATSLATS